ncbi:amidohydrolase family protein [Fulvivirga sediminis]|uniref:PD40 domain-containing protein n=1 Tax=Fulvivirga sediminis TaxID=2803949 RepID=A0A937K1D8_9BACT|nr:amidohydrolase family protein [Fulvivirga sediminis]MBL3657235.1 PD40 domain-containing protein [Fulvivirga sediminis]
MNIRIHKIIILIFFILLQSCGQEQTKYFKDSRINLSYYTKNYVALDTSKIALFNANVYDGTGNLVRESQTILIQNGTILEIENTDKVQIPDDFYKINVAGKTIIPGIIGMHNHMRIPGSAMLATSPKLYLASGVTTIQTCGTGNPYEELAIAKSIANGEQPGPEIINSGPYFTGPDGKSNFIRFTDEKMVRDTIRYWADKGVKWLKVYRNTRPSDLQVIVDEAHKNNLKVTGHLCATTYSEATEMGIDAIEHGFIHNYDHAIEREIGICSGNTNFRTNLAVESEEVKRVQQKFIKNGVALGSTLAIFEAQANVEADVRDLDVMAPYHRKAYDQRKIRKKEQGEDWYFKKEWLRKSMAYELQFFRQGGLLVAGLDPGLHNMPGFGDQKNYELFIEAGFKPEEAIQVMTSNGAKLLERTDIGTVEKGKIANLVILDGNLENDPKVIRAIEMVLKNGIGYDPNKLVNSIIGNVGSQTDNLMTYFGQKAPLNEPELFAPNIISRPDRYEFGCTLSKDGTEFYFGVDNSGIMEIHFTNLIDGVWSPQMRLFESDSISYNDPMFSPDQKRLYFISNRSLDGKKKKEDIDIWYIERESIKAEWSSPKNLGLRINSGLDEYYVSFADNGTLYFASKDKSKNAPHHAFDIYRSEYKKGQFLKPEILPETINTDRYEADVFIAPDESYMIFCSIRKNGLGKGDLYISFKDKEENWSEAVNMGASINTEEHELCPFVSADGKYLFYTSNQDIYWVNTDILENYKGKTAGNRVDGGEP